MAKKPTVNIRSAGALGQKPAGKHLFSFRVWLGSSRSRKLQELLFSCIALNCSRAFCRFSAIGAL